MLERLQVGFVDVGVGDNESCSSHRFARGAVNDGLRIYNSNLLVKTWEQVYPTPILVSMESAYL